MSRASSWLGPITAALLVLPVLQACSSSGGGSSGAQPTPAADASSSAPIPDGAPPTDPDAGSSDAGSPPFPADALAPMELRSSAFDDGADLPGLYTCDGAERSLPFAWSVGPAGTKAYAIVLTDTTVGAPDNVHWILYDVTATYVLSPVPTGPTGPGTSHQARSSFVPDTNGYSAPCPDTTKHSYKVTLYAVDEMPLSGVTASTPARDVVARLEARKLATASMVSAYKRE